MAFPAARSLLLWAASPDALDRARESIAWSVAKFVQKGKLEESRNSILDRITTATRIDDSVDADLVIEAVVENIDLKREVFERLDAVCPLDGVCVLPVDLRHWGTSALQRGYRFCQCQ